MDRLKSPAVVAFWQDFRRARGVPEQAYDVCRTGDNPVLADESLALILAGPKRATACLLRDVEQGVEMMGRVGAQVVATDAHVQPRAIWRTKTIEVKPLDQVDEAFALDEGEGERTREGWLAQHTMYFERRARAEGFVFSPSMPAVFERFTLVWPPEYADTEGS
jgi:uncharacterized protein YhfF